MQDILATAGILMTFITFFVEVFKPLLPAPADPAKQNSVVRLFTAGVSLAVSLGVYFFTADHYSKQALGQALVTAAVAAMMATGLWHGWTIGASNISFGSPDTLDASGILKTGHEAASPILDGSPVTAHDPLASPARTIQ